MTNDVGLIETIRVHAGQAPLLELHRQRLARGCSALGLPLPPLPPVPPVAASAWRWSVQRTGLTAALRPLPGGGPVTVAIATVPFRPYPHKTTDRAQFDRASREAEAAGAEAAVLLTSTGAVVEGSIWSVFWWEDDRVAAPPARLGILESVSRARIAAIAGPLLEGEVDTATWERRSPFLANAVRGPVPVAAVEGRPVVQSPATARLAASFWG